MPSYLPVALRSATSALTTAQGASRALACMRPAAAQAVRTAAPAAVARYATQSLVGRPPAPRTAGLPPVSPPTPGSPARTALTDVVNRSFPKVTDDLKAWLRNFNQLNCFEMYDGKLSSYGLLPNESTFVGDRCCQMTTHLLALELENAGYNVRLLRNDFRYGNHFYLDVTGKGLTESMIVDPTYRQFFRADVDDGRNFAFNRELFVYRPPCFVGPRQELSELAQEYTQTLPPTAPARSLYEDGTVFWKERSAVDVTPQLKHMRPKMLSFITRRLQPGRS